jgi:hypothetical protein
LPIKKNLFGWVLGFFIYSRYYLLIRYMICKYFLLCCGLPFHFLGDVLWSRKFLILMKFNLSAFSLTDCAFGVITKKSSPNCRSWKCFIFIFLFYHFYIYSHMYILFGSPPCSPHTRHVFLWGFFGFSFYILGFLIHLQSILQIAWGRDSD